MRHHCCGWRAQRWQAGVAAVEFAIVLPFLMLLLLSVIDMARAIQAKIILVNISREGANLASRGSLQLSDSAQSSMTALAATAPPLSMGTRGMIYITKIMGYSDKNGLRNVVLEQYRWDDTANGVGYSSNSYAPASQVWTCNASWNKGSCSGIATGASAPVVTLMSGQLADGELIYAVETFYKFDAFFSGLKLGSMTTPVIGPNLYASTIF